MSEPRRADRLTRPRDRGSRTSARSPGPATPHFALQIRNRIRRLIEPLPAGDPARAEGERQIVRLEELAATPGSPAGRPGAGR